MKVLEKIKENKIFFVTFILLAVTCVSFLTEKNWVNLMDNFYYPLYVVNYDCGYSSRLLVGAVFSLFFKDTLNVDVLSNVMLAVYGVMCFCMSLFINNYLKKTNFEAIGIYAVFMVLSPAFLSFLRYFGIVDSFWIFFVLGSLWSVDKKGWRWLVPVFCIIALAIHEVFATTYLPVVAIAVLYQFIKKPDISNFVYIAVCALVVSAASIYFLIIGDGTMKMTSDEMVEFARNRLDEKGSMFDDFYLRSVFFWEVPEVEKYEGFLGYLQYNFEIYTTRDNSAIKSILYFIISNILSLIPFLYLVIKSFTKEKNPAKKFCFFCCLIPIPLSVIQLLLSTDTERFSMHLLYVTLFLLLFLIKEKDNTFCEAYEDAKIKLHDSKASLALLGIAVARIVFSGVRF